MPDVHANLWLNRCFHLRHKVPAAKVFVDWDNVSIRTSSSERGSRRGKLPRTWKFHDDRLLEQLHAVTAEIADDVEVLIFTNMLSQHASADRQQLARLCRDHGFTIIHCQPRNGLDENEPGKYKDSVDENIIEMMLRRHKELDIETAFVLVTSDNDFTDVVSRITGDSIRRRDVLLIHPLANGPSRLTQVATDYTWLHPYTLRDALVKRVLARGHDQPALSIASEFHDDFPHGLNAAGDLVPATYGFEPSAEQWVRAIHHTLRHFALIRFRDKHLTIPEWINLIDETLRRRMPPMAPHARREWADAIHQYLRMYSVIVPSRTPSRGRRGNTLFTTNRQHGCLTVHYGERPTAPRAALSAAR